MGANRTLTLSNTGTVSIGAINLSTSSNNRTLTLTGTGNATITGTIANGGTSSASGIIKSGSGTVTLSGSNSYGGTTQIQGGTLSINSIGNVGGGNSAIGAPTTAANGTIKIGSTTTGATLAYTGATASSNRVIDLAGTTGGATIDASGTGTLTLTSNFTATGGGSKTLTLTGSNTGNNTISGAIVDNSGTNKTSVAKTGNGTWVLSGNSSYTGTTSISSGILRATSNAGALGAGNLTITGGTLQLANDTGLAFNRPTTVSGTTTLVSDRLTLGGGVTHTLGTLSINGQTLNVNAGSLVNSGTAGITFGATTLSGNPVFDIGTGALLTLGALADGGVTARTITKQDAGTLTLSAAATSLITGTAVNITGGTLNANVAGALGTLANVTLTSPGTFALGANQTIGALNGTGGTVSLGSQTLTVGSTNNLSSSYAGTITGNGGLTKAGTGTLTLTAASSYTGATSINAGTLNIQNSTALGTGSTGISIATGAALELQGGGITVVGKPLSFTGTGTLRNVSGNNRWEGNLTLSSSATINSVAGQLKLGEETYFSNTVTLGSNTLTVSGAGDTWINAEIGGNGGVTKTGTGTLTYYATQNPYIGTTAIQAGTLIVDTQTNSFPNDPNFTNKYGINGPVTIGTGSGAANSAILQLGATVGPNAKEVLNFTTVITMYKDGYFNLNNQDQSIGGLNMTGGLIASGAGTLFLNGDVTTFAIAGSTAVINGTLSLTIDNGPVPATRTFTVGAGAGNTSDLTINAQINNGSIIKAGTGTMTITSDNLNGYGGTTTINNGVLNIQHARALGTTSGGLPANGTVVNTNGTLQLQGGIAVGTEALTLNGTGYNSLGALNSKSGNNSWAGPITLGTASTIKSDTVSNTLTISGSVTGSGANNLTVDGVGNTTISGSVGTNNGGIIKDGNGTLTLSGDNLYLGTTTINTGVVNVQHSNGLGSTVAGTTVALNSELQLQGGITVGAETLGLNGTGVSGGGALRNISGSNSWAGAVTLNGTSRINSDLGTLTVSGNIGGTNQNLIVGGVGNTTLSGAIATGTGTLTKDGAGTLTLSGSSANNFSGGLSVNDGTVILNKTFSGVSATGSGNITVGDSSGSANSAVLQFGQTNQVASTASLTINSDGKFDLNGQTQTVATLAGSGHLAVGSGTLTVGNASNSSFSGALSIASGGLLQKVGSGTLTISSVPAAQSMASGTIQLDAGTLEFASSALSGGGATIGTLILNGGTLRLNGGTLNVTNLQINGATTIDFGNGVAATLDVTGTLTIGNVGSGGVSITNWVSAVDHFFAQNWTNATFNTKGTYEEQKIQFNGYLPTDTGWIPYGPKKEITPVPEPGTYGAILMGLSLAGLGFRRWRSSRRK
ncbi:MAG: autotransporter-associated beta strand repeat-containing protein [Opitutae bacterium]|nr:autotransporter-associated beta strand repeat-containing protein [Opitutae bacterium]